MRTFHQRAAACLVALALAAAWASDAAAQAIGGNASLSVSTSSAAVALPANLQSYPSLMIVPAPASTGEAFYLLGSSTVTALTTSPALPPGGVCINVGPNTTLAAITATGAATLRLTQLNTCAGFSGAGGNGSGGTPTPAEPYLYTPLSPEQHNLGITSATGLTRPTGSLFATICASGNNVNYTFDGTTTPTSSIGMPLLQGQCVFLSGATVLANFKAIQQAATATLDVAYTK